MRAAPRTCRVGFRGSRAMGCEPRLRSEGLSMGIGIQVGFDSIKGRVYRGVLGR